MNANNKINSEVEEALEIISLKIEEIESFAKVIYNAVENDYSELDEIDIKNTLSILVNTITVLKKEYYDVTDKMGI